MRKRFGVPIDFLLGKKRNSKIAWIPRTLIQEAQSVAKNKIRCWGGFYVEWSSE